MMMEKAQHSYLYTAETTSPELMLKQAPKRHHSVQGKSALKITKMQSFSFLGKDAKLTSEETLELEDKQDPLCKSR